MNFQREHTAGRSRLIAPAVFAGLSSVVLFAVDGTAGVILAVVQGGAFLAGHHAVSFGPILGPLHTVLLAFQACGFVGVQGAGLDTLFDPAFLVFLPLIDPRGVGAGSLGHGGGKGGRSQCGDEQFFHDSVLRDGWLPTQVSAGLTTVADDTG
ncbi:MAG: hypothetical protein AB7I68_03240 [Porticoccaceae bacterium]